MQELADGLGQALARRGIKRREFLKFCSTMVGILALPPRYVDRVALALQQVTRPVMVWLEFQDCAGNTESMLRSSHPRVLDVVLDLLSWEYHDTIMAGAGAAAEATLDRILRDEKGKFIAAVEGAIPLADGGVYCCIGGRTALDIARSVLPNAAATLAIGACAWDGGIVSPPPNPTGAVGVSEAVPGVPIVNIGGCPHNVANTAAVLVHYLTFGQMPALDAFNRPLFAYGQIIHDQCERRAHYDAGRYVEEWGDEGHRRGWCLYRMGCKGPQATYNCPSVRWNDQTSWPVHSGHGCIACAYHGFWKTMSPFYERLPNVPGFGADVTAEKIGLGLTAATAVGFGVHAAASITRAQLRQRGVFAGADRSSTEPAAPPPVETPPATAPSGEEEDEDATHSN